MTDTLLPFDMTAMLDTDEAITEYLSQALADGDTDELIRAVAHVANGRGMGVAACKDTSTSLSQVMRAIGLHVAPGIRVTRQLGDCDH